jgi:hypothetical protein
MNTRGMLKYHHIATNSYRQRIKLKQKLLWNIQKYNYNKIDIWVDHKSFPSTKWQVVPDSMLPVDCSCKLPCYLFSDELCTILLIGDTEVGKTCLLSQFTRDSYTPSYESTIGVEFSVRNVQVNGKKVRLHLVRWIVKLGHSP